MSSRPTPRPPGAGDRSSAAFHALDDAHLLAAEAELRERFLEERGDEPALSDTTYREYRGSARLLEVWAQWLRALRAVALRGIGSTRSPRR